MTAGVTALAATISFGVGGTAIAAGGERGSEQVSALASGPCSEGFRPSADARAACYYLGTTQRYEAIEIPFTSSYLLRYRVLDRCVQADEGQLYLVFCDTRDRTQQWTRDSVSPEGTIYRNHVNPDICVGVANSAASGTPDRPIPFTA
jgi:hypothetical protein